MRHTRVSLLWLFCLCLIALVTGCGSTDSGNSGSFSLSADSVVTIAQGTSQTFTVTPTGADGFTGSIQLSVSGLPTGVTLSPANATVKTGVATTFTLTAAANAAVGTASVTVQGVSGALSAKTVVSVVVTAATTTTPPPTSGDFTLTTSPATLSLVPGASGQVTLSATGTGSFGGTIAIAVNNLPTGVTASPSTISLTPNNPVQVTLTAASNAPATATPVQVSFVGTSGSLSHTATIQLTVTAVTPTGPDFSMTASPSTITVAQGQQSGLIDVGMTALNGFTGDVTFTVSGLPTGVTVIPSGSQDLESGWTDPIVFNAASNAAIGNATVTITGTSGVLSHTATIALTVSGPPPTDFVAVALSPASETVTVGSIGTVSVTATATQGYTGTVQVSAQNLPAGVTLLPATADLTPGVARTFTIVASASAQPGTATVTFLGQVNSVSGSAALSLTIASPANNGLDVPTWHYDAARTGLDASETVLKPATVSASTFMKYGIVPTDGAVDAQPLYISGLTIGGQSHNVLFLATENGTVYAWDALSGTHLWQASTLGSNETAADNQGCSELGSQVGITATPAIDRNYGPDGAIFVVAKTKDGNGNYHQRLHALDLLTGAELSGSPVDIAATSGASSFDPGISVERAALLVNSGIVYLSWGAPCHQTTFDYSGWVMAYNEGTLEQLSVLDVTPNGSGGGIWMSGAGPAADSNGNVFLITSTGTFDTALNASGQPKNGDYGNGYLKIESPNGAMTIYDYFEPLNGVPGSVNYADQGSGGIMLTPGIANNSQFVPPQAIGAGKDGNIYQIGSAGNVLGEYNGTTNNDLNTLTGALPNGATSSPAYFNNAFYYGGSSDVLREFTLSTTSASLTTQSASTLGTAGATPVITANGTSTPILWALDTTASGGAVLHAYDATNLTTELYNSNQSGARDTIGTTDAHAVPLIANGFVYVGTQSGLAIFGPLP
jgi:hypothetical protein